MKLLCYLTTYQSAVADQGEGPGAHLIFRPNLGPNGRGKFIFEGLSTSYSGQGLDVRATNVPEDLDPPLICDVPESSKTLLIKAMLFFFAHNYIVLLPLLQFANILPL